MFILLVPATKHNLTCMGLKEHSRSQHVESITNLYEMAIDTDQLSNKLIG